MFGQYYRNLFRREEQHSLRRGGTSGTNSRRGRIELLEDRSMLSVNLIENGGFETATGVQSLPPYPTELDHWFAVNTDGEIINDDTRAYQGEGFLSLLQSAGGNPTSNWLGASWQFDIYDRAGQLIDVAAESTYTVSFAYRGGDGSRFGYTAGDLFFQIEEVSPDNETIYTDLISTDSMWHGYSHTFTTGDDTESIVILFSGDGSNNVDVWIDEVQLYDTPPQVTNVTISGSNSTHDPYDFSMVVGDGDQIRTVPVGGANTIDITFSEDVTLTGNELTLQSAQDSSFYSLDYLGLSGTTATWELTSGVFPADQIILTLDDSVTNSDGVLQLDGEWTNPLSLTDTGTSVFPSGNGVAGGDFEFYFTILPGDASRNNWVELADQDIVLTNWGAGPGQTFTQGDTSGNGFVELADLDAVLGNWGKDFTEWPVSLFMSGSGGGSSSSAFASPILFDGHKTSAAPSANMVRNSQRSSEYVGSSSLAIATAWETAPPTDEDPLAPASLRDLEETFASGDHRTWELAADEVFAELSA